MVSGGGIKPWRQKGTGRARQGSIRSPQWAGGGVVFGPVPRSYEHALPKKVRRAALCGALSLRRQEGAITVVDEIALDEFKTQRVREILRSLSLDGERVLIVIDASRREARALGAQSARRRRAARRGPQRLRRAAPRQAAC